MEEPDLSLDSQALEEARLHMQMKREYSAEKARRFASVLSRKPPGASFWIEAVRLPSTSPDNSFSPPKQC